MKWSRRKSGRNAVAAKVACVRFSKQVAMKDLAVLQAPASTLAKSGALKELCTDRNIGT